MWTGNQATSSGETDSRDCLGLRETGRMLPKAPAKLATACQNAGAALLLQLVGMADLRWIDNKARTSDCLQPRFGALRVWLWVKNRVTPKMGCPIGKWKHGRTFALSWWFNFDPYPYVSVHLFFSFSLNKLPRAHVWFPVAELSETGGTLSLCA